jgi:hypothetical protein
VSVVSQRVALSLAAATTMALPIAVTIVVPVAAGAAGGCQTKLTLIKGNPVEVSCGSATAKLHYKGKAYSFKSGTCRKSGAGGTLSLGKNVDVKRNAGLVGLSIAFLGNGLHSATVVGYQGGVFVSGSGTSTKLASTGTITGASGSTPFTVSWNCGGAFSTS